MPVTNYVWDPLSNNVLLETDENDVTQAVYTQEPDTFGNLISQRRDDETSWYHFDGLGSTRELTDATESVTDTNMYDAWGVDVASTGTTDNPFHWVGESGYYDDPETGDYYVRARTYRPTIARWLSADPLGPLDVRGSYLYSFCNSTHITDPSGLYPFVEGEFYNCCCNYDAKLPDVYTHPSGPGVAPGWDRLLVDGDRCCNKLRPLIEPPTQLSSLIDCAVRHGCLGSRCHVYCRVGCSRNRVAGYWRPYPLFTSPQIYVCEHALGQYDTRVVLLEEVYHALTICISGNSVGRSLHSLDIATRYLPRRERRCGECLGRELLAVRCARRPHGCMTLDRCLHLVMSSCESHCRYAADWTFLQFRRTRLAANLSMWMLEHVDADCDRIDGKCGV